jgi:hypothetical protein
MKKRHCIVQIVNVHCMSGFVDSVSRIHFQQDTVYLCLHLFRLFSLKYYCLAQGIQKNKQQFLLWLFCIPGKPLGPGAPEGPGGPVGPGGPGVKVDSRTAVVSAKTFTMKIVCDKHLYKSGLIMHRISKNHSGGF